MKLNDVLNFERVNSLSVERNAYVNVSDVEGKGHVVKTQSAEKVIFPEPYENANRYYNRNDFNSYNINENNNKSSNNSKNLNMQNDFSMFDIKSILPMLMSGKFNDVLKPLMSMFGGGGGSSGIDLAKIFELFKSKSKVKKDNRKKEEDNSKFDNFIIIED